MAMNGSSPGLYDDPTGLLGMVGDSGSMGDDEEYDPITGRRNRKSLKLNPVSLLRKQYQGGSVLDTPTDTSTDDVPTPPGFDATGMPEEYPATAKKNAALKRRDDLIHPTTNWKADLVKAALQALPLVLSGGYGGEGMAEGLQYAQQQKELGKTRAEGEYQFEAGQEEKQREGALKERLTMSQIGVNQTYKRMMAKVAQQKANTADDRLPISALAAGYETKIGPNGERTFVPTDAKRAKTELDTAKLGLTDAQTDLAAARAKGVPEEIEIKRKAYDAMLMRVDQAQARLDQGERRLDLQERSFGINYYGKDPATGAPPPGQPMINGQVVGTRNKPPTIIEDRATQAQIIGKTSQELISDIKGNAKYLGPVMGRYGTLTDFVGNPPTQYAEMASQLMTYIALQPAAHGFRGLRAVAEFEKSIGTPIRTPEALIAAITGNVKGLGAMAGATGRFQGATPADLHLGDGAGAGGAAGKLKRRRPNSGAGNPPEGARVRDYTQIQ